MFLNPVVLATFCGLILWIIQPYMPKISGISPTTKTMVNVAFYRIDVTAPWIYKPLSYLASLASPLAWLAIGSTLGEISVKQVVKSLGTTHL